VSRHCVADAALETSLKVNGAPITRRLGMALADALDELIHSGHINPQLAMRVLAQVCVFPYAIAILRTQV
jgi:hypothetical protein